MTFPYRPKAKGQQDQIRSCFLWADLLGGKTFCEQLAAMSCGQKFLLPSHALSLHSTYP